MCPVNNYFDTIFAEDGDLTAIPDDTQSNGTVSYQQGFPVSYSTPVASGGYNVPRTSINQVLNDITTAVQQIQQNGAPPFITSVMNGGSPFSYSAGAIVIYGGAVYVSLVNGNVTTPTIAGGIAAWRLLLQIPAVGECLFQYTSATIATLVQQKGNQISFPNGAVGILPSAGYPSTVSSCYLNGVAAQPLADSNLYYAYAWFNSADALVVDFSTTGYSKDASTGIEIKTGDPTRVFVGMAYVDAAGNFEPLYVRSFFNDNGIIAQNNFTTTRTTNSTSPAEINTEIRINVLLFANEKVLASTSGVVENSVGGQGVGTGLGVDSTTVISGSQSGGVSSSGGFGIPSATNFVTNSLSEGPHFFTLLGFANSSGTAEFSSLDYVTVSTRR